jgi:hypothetical protein
MAAEPGAARAILAASAIDGHGVDKQQLGCVRGEEDKGGFAENPLDFRICLGKIKTW